MPTDEADLKELMQRFTDKRDDLLNILRNPDNSFLVDVMEWDCLKPEDRVPNKAIVAPIDGEGTPKTRNRRRRAATAYTYSPIDYVAKNYVTSVKVSYSAA